MGSKTDLTKKGAAQAAFLSAMLGVLALALVNLGAQSSAAFKALVHKMGKLWMPGAEGIGPYSGKETISLVVWLLSWWILHLMLRDKEWDQKVVIGFFLVGIALATTLLWPPVFYLLSGH
jgi:hypothetical protein